jgi:hypothetical protein
MFRFSYDILSILFFESRDFLCIVRVFIGRVVVQYVYLHVRMHLYISGGVSAPLSIVALSFGEQQLTGDAEERKIVKNLKWLDVACRS